MKPNQKRWYVYHGAKLVEVIDTYTADGAKLWAASMHNLPVHELVASTTIRETLKHD